MKIKYLDAHCHVQFAQYDADRDALIARMKDEGVAGIVVGCDLESSKKAIALAESHEHLFASVGLHPNREPDEWYEIEQYRELAKHPKVVAIGECGLDYFRPVELTDEVKKKQKYALLDQVRLAGESGLPLIIHSRPSKRTQDAYEDVIRHLVKAKETYPDLRGDIHFFVGGEKEAEAFVALGFTVSYTAVITFAHEYDSTMRTLPLTHILSETDAPYVPPMTRPKGSRNDPLAVVEVVKRIAEIRGEDPEMVRSALLGNALRLFTLPGVEAA